MDFWRQIDMARPYSDDLREKFVSAYEAGDIGLEKLASTFKVSRAWAGRIWKAKRETGKTERPAGKPRGFPSRLTPEIRLRLAAISQSAPTAQITSGGGIHPCSNR
jgi:transposase